MRKNQFKNIQQPLKNNTKKDKEKEENEVPKKTRT